MRDPWAPSPLEQQPPMDVAPDLLERARSAFRRRDWVVARDGFAAARANGPLEADDVYAAADAAWWLGKLDESLGAMEEAFDRYMASGQPRRAVLAAFSIAYTNALRGEESMASAWMSRALRVLQDEPENAEHGYLAYMEFESALSQGAFDVALQKVRRVAQWASDSTSRTWLLSACWAKVACWSNKAT